MTDLITRTKIVAKAAVTWLIVAATILAVIADELAAELGADHIAVTVCIRAVAVIGVAVSIIRRVTPVLEGARGILPVDGPVTSDEAWLARELEQIRSLTP